MIIKDFNKFLTERYTRTVGFRYSEPNIRFNLEASAEEPIDVDRLEKTLNKNKVKFEIVNIEDDYLSINIYVYNEKEIHSIVEKIIFCCNIIPETIDLTLID